MVYTKKTDWGNQPVFFESGILVGLCGFNDVNSPGAKISRACTGQYGNCR